MNGEDERFPIFKNSFLEPLNQELWGSVKQSVGACLDLRAAINEVTCQSKGE